MEFKNYLIEQLNSNRDFLNYTLADLSDADMFVRPCPNANHAAWQLGHMISSEASVQKNIAPSTAVALPVGFIDVYKMDANKLDDASKFAPFNTKAQLLEWFGKIRGGTIVWVEAMSPEQLDEPTPDKYKAWAATFGELAAGQIVHAMMHIGQFSVIRRRLGKPVLF